MYTSWRPATSLSARMCLATGCKVDAAMAPDAAAEGVPIPGKHESPQRKSPSRGVFMSGKGKGSTCLERRAGARQAGALRGRLRTAGITGGDPSGARLTRRPTPCHMCHGLGEGTPRARGGSPRCGTRPARARRGCTAQRRARGPVRAFGGCPRRQRARDVIRHPGSARTSARSALYASYSGESASRFSHGS